VTASTSPNAAIIDRRYNKWLNLFAWFTAVATLFLICSGGMVTSKNAGLAVPDWPTTFGYNMFFFPFSKWIGGVFFEHIHRLIASTVGFLTIILTVWLWRSETRRWVRNLGYAALAAVVIQGVLGGLRVTLLRDEIGIFHACLAQAYFATLIVIALVTTNFWDRLSLNPVQSENVRILVRVSIITAIIIYVQLTLGATMRHQHRDLSILDFPLAYGKIIPDVSPQRLAVINAVRDAQALSDVNAFQIWLQLAHRFVALIIATFVIAFWFLVRRHAPQSSSLQSLSTWWVSLVACQIAFGAWTIWSNKAADIATAHVAIGAAIFALGVAVVAICLRLAQTKVAGKPIPQPLVPETARSL
jgi:cytochrome c oxidase assembly protein subunit 15